MKKNKEKCGNYKNFINMIFIEKDKIMVNMLK